MADNTSPAGLDELLKAANPLDRLGSLPTETLATALENPEFSASIEKAGFSKRQLLQTAKAAALFYDIKEAFAAINHVQSFDRFMSDVMLPLSIEYGPDGQPVKLEDGRYKTDGTVERFFICAEDYSAQIKGRIIEQLAKSNPESDDAKELQKAAKIMRRFEQNWYNLPLAPSTIIPVSKGSA